jgi:hypothetical protein
LAVAFWKEHSLNETKQDKLEAIIIQHLKGALDWIEEESDDIVQ